MHKNTGIYFSKLCLVFFLSGVGTCNEDNSEYSTKQDPVDMHTSIMCSNIKIRREQGGLYIATVYLTKQYTCTNKKY